MSSWRNVQYCLPKGLDRTTFYGRNFIFHHLTVTGACVLATLAVCGAFLFFLRRGKAGASELGLWLNDNGGLVIFAAWMFSLFF